MQTAKTNSDIIRYYEQAEIDYKLLWRLKDQLAMHYGFWSKGVRTLARALENENSVLASMAGITAADHVLDAGCGVGGSSLYLARTTSCRVTGISITGKQVASAQQSAARQQLSDLVTFQTADYTAMPFPDRSFDVVWAVESVCHANAKQQFLTEAFRVLKPGGRLILADFFATKERFEGQEEAIMDTWLDGWGVTELDTLQQFCASATSVGFAKVIANDQTPLVTRSARLLYRYSLLTAPADWATRKIGWRTDINRRNVLAVRYQYRALKRHLWQYATVSAVKP